MRKTARGRLNPLLMPSSIRCEITSVSVSDLNTWPCCCNSRFSDR